MREILHAIFYVVKSGCPWRLLPHDDFSPWKTVYHYSRIWRLDGTWERMHRALHERVRVRMKRDPQPSSAGVSRWPVKTTGVGGEQRGYDGGKKVKGGKRHLLVDTQRLVLKAKVHSAKIQDRKGIKVLLDLGPKHLPRLGNTCEWMPATPEKVRERSGWRRYSGVDGAQIVRQPPKLAPDEVMRRWILREFRINALGIIRLIYRELDFRQKVFSEFSCYFQESLKL